MRSLSAPDHARLYLAAGLRPDGSVPHAPAWSVTVPPTPGVYVISDLRGPLYAGRSVDLRRRFAEHYEASHNDLLVQALRRPVGMVNFTWFTSDTAGLAALEHDIVTRLHPMCNVVTPRQPNKDISTQSQTKENNND